jgi:hypothetical protein
MKIIKNIFYFYVNGFKNIDKLGIKLWVIIAIKLFIMFAILKIFFFPDFLNSKFDSDKDKGNYVIETLIN